jgi:hypothetical protein
MPVRRSNAVTACQTKNIEKTGDFPRHSPGAISVRAGSAGRYASELKTIRFQGLWAIIAMAAAAVRFSTPALRIFAPGACSQYEGS